MLLQSEMERQRYLRRFPVCCFLRSETKQLFNALFFIASGHNHPVFPIKTSDKTPYSIVHYSDMWNVYQDQNIESGSAQVLSPSCPIHTPSLLYGGLWNPILNIKEPPLFLPRPHWYVPIVILIICDQIYSFTCYQNISKMFTNYRNVMAGWSKQCLASPTIFCSLFLVQCPCMHF